MSVHAEGSVAQEEAVKNMGEIRSLIARLNGGEDTIRELVDEILAVDREHKEVIGAYLTSTVTDQVRSKLTLGEALALVPDMFQGLWSHIGTKCPSRDLEDVAPEMVLFIKGFIWKNFTRFQSQELVRRGYMEGLPYTIQAHPHIVVGIGGGRAIVQTQGTTNRDGHTFIWVCPTHRFEKGEINSGKGFTMCGFEPMGD